MHETKECCTCARSQNVLERQAAAAAAAVAQSKRYSLAATKKKTHSRQRALNIAGQTRCLLNFLKQRLKLFLSFLSRSLSRSHCAEARSGKCGSLIWEKGKHWAPAALPLRLPAAETARCVINCERLYAAGRVGVESHILLITGCFFSALDLRGFPRVSRVAANWPKCVKAELRVDDVPVTTPGVIPPRDDSDRSDSVHPLVSPLPRPLLPARLWFYSKALVFKFCFFFSFAWKHLQEIEMRETQWLARHINASAVELLFPSASVTSDQFASNTNILEMISRFYQHKWEYKAVDRSCSDYFTLLNILLKYYY